MNYANIFQWTYFVVTLEVWEVKKCSLTIQMLYLSPNYNPCSV